MVYYKMCIFVYVKDFVEGKRRKTWGDVMHACILTVNLLTLRVSERHRSYMEKSITDTSDLVLVVIISLRRTQTRQRKEI